MAKVSFGVKRKATSSTGPVDNPELQSWVDEFAPRSKEKLAVHKKKVEEVESWMGQNVLTAGNVRQKAPILLVVGPTGCGKTITVKLVANELGIHIKEWIHPTVQDSKTSPEFWRGIGTQECSKESVVEHFMDFLFQGSRYKSLFEDDSRRMILLEEIPSSFLQKPDKFHDALREYRTFGRCPLVIMLCETSSSREFKLFPPDLKREINIHTVSFNPIAITLLMKAVKDVISEASRVCGKNFSHPVDSAVESVTHSCQGDLRLAVNLLELTCMGTAKKLADFRKKKTKSTKNTDAKNDTAGAHAKDSSLYLFHSLGKILYSKREDKVVHQLPNHLRQHERPPTKEIPEEVFERTCVSQDLFTRMLQNNALNFYGNIRSASNCSEFFSLGDHINSMWDPSGTLNSLAISVAMRGLMFHLEKPEGKTHFGTFKKPTYDRRVTEDLATQVRHEFLMHGTSTDMLVMDVLPYSFMIRPSNLKQVQWDVLNKCVLVRRSALNTPGQLEISEKDVFDDEDKPIEPNLVHREEALETIETGSAAEDFEIEEIDFD